MSTIFQVIQVALVGISLAFKGNVTVSVAPHGQSHQPLDAIGQIKENNKHLALLGSVDALVVHQFIAQVNARMHKKHSQQINRGESLERQYFCPEYLQRYKGNAFCGFSQPLGAVSAIRRFHLGRHSRRAAARVNRETITLGMAFNAVAQTMSVAPVVTTSSTRRMCFPAQRSAPRVKA